MPNCYLLTGIVPPTFRQDIKHDILPTGYSPKAIKLAKTGISVKSVALVPRERIPQKTEIPSEPRYAFWFKDREIDDIKAQKFADSVAGALALVKEIVSPDGLMAIPISTTIVGEQEIIKLKDIPGLGGLGSEKHFASMEGIGIPEEDLKYLWKIVPAIFNSEILLNATHYFMTSIGEVWIADDDVFEFMHNLNRDKPSTIAERTRLESAYQNAYKAIEANIGEPPKDRRKLINTMRESGLNPDEIVGWNMYGLNTKESMVDKIVNMQQFRDRKVAHGKTSYLRDIGYFELKDIQGLASYVIQQKIRIMI
jgi:hypothetical protein